MDYIRTILFLLLGITSNAILVSAKIGEQENWYLAKEINLEIDGFTPGEGAPYYAFDVHLDKASGEEQITIIRNYIPDIIPEPSLLSYTVDGRLLYEND